MTSYPAVPTVWIYSILVLKFNDNETRNKLNEYGIMGWELVSVIEGEGIDFTRTFYFKRPR